MLRLLTLATFLVAGWSLSGLLGSIFGQSALRPGSSAPAIVPAVGMSDAPASQSISRAVVGTWDLSSLYDEDATGNEITTFAADPRGRLVFDQKGRFSLQIFGDLGLADPACGQPATARTKVQSGNLAYYGTYFFKPDHVIDFHVEQALASAWNGTDRFATVTVDANRLDLVASAIPTPTGSFYSHLIWKRLK